MEGRRRVEGDLLPPTEGCRLMFIIQNDNSDARLLAMQQQIDEIRAEIDRLKAHADAAPADRKEYMRSYMARRRAEAKASNAQPERN